MTADMFIGQEKRDFPQPRAFQITAHESLREGIRQGHRRQLLVAPTGAGKTYLGLRVAHETLAKGRRALFVCDRTALINQTSDRADSYGLSAHGIVQANHSRRDNLQPFQIASIQTIQARGYWPEADVIVIDEAHTQYTAWKDHLKTTTAAVVGLTATPCSRGLGLHFTHMVNAATMHDLTEIGVLVPLRILSCTTPDMAGAETSGGEWTDRAAAEREAQIIGDVVQEWITRAENRKTIAFGASIAYCEELARRFNAAGVTADIFTSETAPAERATLLAEFRKPDSEIRVLVSVEALAKGFDVEDIGCVIDARPLRKSFSTAVQMWGRGLRSSPDTGKQDCLLLDHCIASGQRVLTDTGLVPIEKVTMAHKLWDGHEFVSHRGVVSRGIRPVIRYAGLTATADHPVKTAEGWCTLGLCADEQRPIRATGIGRKAVRECDDYFSNASVVGAAGKAISACALRMRYMRLSCIDRAFQFRTWCYERLSGLQPAEAVPEMALRSSQRHATALQESKGPQVCRLRRSRDRVPFRFRDYWRSVDQKESGNSGPAGIYGAGSLGQRWSLRAGQSEMGAEAPQYEQHAGILVRSAIPQISAGAPRGPLRRFVSKAIDLARTVIRRDRRSLETTEPQTEREVWDILDAGPRNCFTCEGLLVHNSGNIVRFLKDFTDIFFNGFQSLDMSEKLDAVARSESGEAKGCPKCHYTPFYKRCMACGFEMATESMVDEAPGEMREIRIGKRVIATDRYNLYQQLCAYARESSKPEKQAGRAWHLYQDITGERPPQSWRFDSTPHADVTSGTLSKIKSLRIAWIKGRKPVAA